MLVVIFAGIAYAATLPRTVFGLDSAELATGAYTLGIVHSPGAPLYMLLGHLVCKLPLGDIGCGLNALSALFGAAGAGLHFLIGLRFTRRVGLAAAAALAVAFNYYIWAWAIVAELYSLHVLFVLLVTWLLLKGDENGRLVWYGLAGLAWGLGMGNHTSLVLMLPAYLWLVLGTPRSAVVKFKVLLLAGIGAIAGLMVYLYFPLRQAASPALNYVRDYFPDINLATPAGLWWMFRGGMFDALYFSDSPGNWIVAWLQHLGQLASSFTPIGFLVALLGIRLSLQSRDRLSIAIILMWICHTGFFASYGALDRRWMYSVSYLVVGWWVALGLTWLWDRWPVNVRMGRIWIPIAVAGILTLMVLNGFRVLDLRRDVSARQYYERIFHILPPRAVFFGFWEQIPILEYGQLVYGLRLDIQLANVVFMDDAAVQRLADQASKEGRPVFASRPLTVKPDAVWIPVWSDRWAIYRLEYDLQTSICAPENHP
ncbi:MAG TPA: DUF2723 domain-containing protein [Kiritimatiellia bacterium]|nr:DUF2723 domain-containing protein [Kiritimatiellia bacterium]